MPTVGHRIQRFEVLQHLGTGGMGSVYRARDPQLHRDVAIKVLANATASSQLSPDDTVDLRGDSAPSRDIAGIEIHLARAEAAFGHLEAARTRVEAARAVLERYPGEIKVRAAANALLASLPNQHRTR